MSIGIGTSTTSGNVGIGTSTRSNVGIGTSKQSTTSTSNGSNRIGTS